jgi:Tol biopolymer transport system component
MGEADHYVITAELGRGGSAVVYSARDTRLDREVALKVTSTIQDRSMETLEREAKTASSLNHPNIVTVHEVVRYGSGVAIVMEKVEGVSLRRLVGELPMERAIDIGRQIASAVAATHSRGIVHRDLKPENVMVRADGYVKVLDFGLARQTIDGGKWNMTNLSSLAGTLLYMSPEQGRGEALTPASDVYSLGLMLDELCSGPRFALKPSRPRGSADGNAPPRWLRGLIARMLRLDPNERPSAYEVAEALSERSVGRSVPGRAMRGRRLAAIAACAAFGLLLYFGWSRTPEGGVLDTRVDLGTSAELEEEGFALSPDGRTLLFVAGRRLNRVSLEGGSAQAWDGAEDGRFPFWSPDGKEAGFYRNGKIWRRRFPDGTAREICSAVEPLSASWGSRGTIVFSAGGGAILQVPASGGTPVAVTRPSNAENLVDTSPTFLPDGTRFLFFRTDGGNKGSLMLGAIDGSRPEIRLGESTTAAIFLAGPRSSRGALVYSQERKLVAHPFHASSGRFTGTPFAITDRVREFRRLVIPASASAGGALVYAEGDDKTDQPKIFDRRGQLVTKLGPKREYMRAVPSPDFERIAVVSRPPGTLLYTLEVLNRVTGESRQVGPPSTGRLPVWSRDGKRILYTESTAAGSMATIENLSRLGEPETRRLLPYRSWLHDWSPDGKLLLITAQVSDTERTIWALPLDPSRLPSQIVRTAARNDEQHWSPDGRFIAYQSNESGQSEVYVIPFPPDGRRWRISSGGGQEPRWRADGKELYYLSLDYALMSVKTNVGTKTLAASPPSHVFGGRSAEPALMVWHYEPSPDGTQFVILTGAKSRGSALRLRLNWWAGFR